MTRICATIRPHFDLWRGTKDPVNMRIVAIPYLRITYSYRKEDIMRILTRMLLHPSGICSNIM